MGSNAGAVVRRMKEERAKTLAHSSALAAPRGSAEGLVVIGASTGGPRALEIVLSGLPASFPWPVLVAQHMPAAFTKAFADRLNQCCELDVLEAGSAVPVVPGRIYIGKGGADTILASRAGRLTILPAPENAQYLWHPSVELLGRSVLQHYDPTHVTAVLLTGMGNDGSDAFTEIKKRGGRTIAESEESAVVYGMPAELVKKGGASLVLSAEKVAAQLIAWAAR
jgi:two-component system chemotaxis response regulator CheB